MAGAFMLLRSYDLLWSKMVNEYLLGDKQPSTNELMAWNSDATRMPYKMHSQYLRLLFLNNDLASGRYIVNDRPISLRDIRAPVFAVATVTDHVAPWRSVYKINDLFNTEITFVLTSGGHNAGIVSEPGHPRRSFQIGLQQAEDKHISPDQWLQQHEKHQAPGGNPGWAGLNPSHLPDMSCHPLSAIPTRGFTLYVMHPVTM
ncbi:hypothetical protein [Nitrincola sp. A-D6]|uniref:hypothetical protein n=1 Tax=Nitrincola sp. A-D6 TaxID=1545442 RepID=UPI001F4008AB|nr:hypothetical protein [Nitrincola sp. A-D6]